MSRIILTVAVLLLFPLATFADGNRLAYLDTMDPYYPHAKFPKLITPQWVGEPGVEAVVILAIDDMRDHKKYETYLRPILNRLKKIDGRAPVSIMTNRINPKEPHLQKWLKEGVSIETHTYDHPCPFFKSGKFATAKETYDKCVDLMNEIPNNRPVAFRMPCCDSMMTPSPRHFAEIFNKTTKKGNFLTIDSSVFCVLTSKDKELPKHLVTEKDGSERFRKYLPQDRTFVNIIEDYPYPYVIGRMCWEFPCIVPSDWEAQHLHKPNNPITVRDWKAALDAVVIKKGVFTMVFHPHGWIRNDQMVDLIDYADRTYGKKVKFLTFGEAQDRLNKHLLAGQPMRTWVASEEYKDGFNGVKLLDVNDDGFMDVLTINSRMQKTRIWQSEKENWFDIELPPEIGKRFWTPQGIRSPNAFEYRLGFLGKEKVLGMLLRNAFYTFNNKQWHRSKVFESPKFKEKSLVSFPFSTVAFRDLDGDGISELIGQNVSKKEFKHLSFGQYHSRMIWPHVHVWSQEKKAWVENDFRFQLSPRKGALNEPRVQAKYIDLNQDGKLDLIFSNENEYGIYLFKDMKTGWSQKVMAGKQGDGKSLPMISRNGTNNGFFVHSRTLWWSNEDTALLKDNVDRRSFDDLLKVVQKEEQPGPKSPEESRKCMTVPPGFKVELVAAEPLVMDPVAFAWGADGKFWVVEMADYPLGIDGKGKHGGRVKFLQDTNGDGKYDKATLFLDGIGYPSGVMPYKKGVLVSCAPDIFYAEDTDGDGKADIRKVLYTGFREGNQQHRVNGFAWGLDNWIYLANGDSGGVIKSMKTGKRVNISGRDIRIRPWTGDIETVTGQTQFGRNRDDWGNWFGGNNSNPMWHFVLEERYLKRNPYLAPPNLRVPVSVSPGSAPVYPISRTLERFNNPQSVNRFTSACSPIVYRDVVLGKEFIGNAFISEPVHNLVHREVMSPRGVTFLSKRAKEEAKSEFLASSDNWFRPALLRTGSDGALYVADMYRHVIEHPQWIPKDWQKKLDLRAGHDMGRIYRVVPVGTKLRPIPNLAKLSTDKLVTALNSRNGWQRDTVQRLLLERDDKKSLPGLFDMVIFPRIYRPQVRMQALCTLDGLQHLAPKEYSSAIGLNLDSASDPVVIRQAIRLSEPYLNKSPKLAKSLLKHLDNKDAQVQLQLICTLGEWDSPEAGKALGEFAVTHEFDPYLNAAWLSSINKKNLQTTLLTIFRNNRQPPKEAVKTLLRMTIAPGNRQALAGLLSSISAKSKDGYADWQWDALGTLLDLLEQRKMSLNSLTKLRNKNIDEATKNIRAMFPIARTAAVDDRSSPAKRIAVLRLLGRGFDQHKEDIARLTDLLRPQQPAMVQAAALVQLAKLPDGQVEKLIREKWAGFTPFVQEQTIDLFLEQKKWTPILLDALAKKTILPNQIDPIRRQRLLEHPVAEIRRKAKTIFAAASDESRAKVLARYQPALKMKADVKRGAKLFTKTCAVCHKLGKVGKEIGPDLLALKDRSREALLEAILDPNKAVEARYLTYAALMKDGRVLAGMIESETANSLTLVDANGKKYKILRTDMEEFHNSRKSLMIEGLEREYSVRDLADLMGYVQTATAELKKQ